MMRTRAPTGKRTAMLKKILPWLCMLGAVLFTPTAMAIEEPSYDVLQASGAFEIRRYQPMLVAETVVEGDMDEASNKGFRLIADFIFGNNQVPGSDERAKIAMTVPVTVEPQSSKIAMTAPVTVEPLADDANPIAARRWRIHFVMPRAYSLQDIPKPRNEAVQLREVPAKYVVVHTYSWLNTASRVQQKTLETLQWAHDRSLKVLGAPQLARYDPPWTPPMFKRNEIMVEISPEGLR